MLLLMLLFGMLSCSSKQNQKNKRTFFVIKILELKLYEHHSLDSKLIKKIKMGEIYNLYTF